MHYLLKVRTAKRQTDFNSEPNESGSVTYQISGIYWDYDCSQRQRKVEKTFLVISTKNHGSD